MTDKKLQVKEVEVVHKGAQIILPLVKGKPMSFDEAITWMQRKKEEENQKVGIYHELECSPLDGAIAFQRAMAKKYGWTHLAATPSFFGPRPPVMVGVPVSTTETVQVPLGRIEIPGIDGFLNTSIKTEGGLPSFIISGEIKRKSESAVNEIVALTKKALKENSIYKGKAVKISFQWMYDENSDGDYDPIKDAPQFMELSGIKDDDLIFGKETLAAINIGLFAPIEYSAACRQHGVPLKRGILLHGPYGTGKTMTAYVSALKAVRNDWTFIYLDSVKDLRLALQFAAKYAPAVLFAEDIDRIVTGERSMGMDEILNTLDGVDTKNGEVITVFTTNHIESINPALLRMGRLDTLVEITPPDAHAAERLVRLYSRGLLATDTDFKKIGKSLEGNIPAFIRETVERAKISAISRLGSGEIEGKVLEVDLLAAADAMKNHAALLAPREETVSHDAEMLIKVPVSNSKAKPFLAAINKLSKGA